MFKNEDNKERLRPYLELGLDDLENEVWKPCIGLDNYEVSNLGRIKSLGRFILTRNGQKRLVPERILKQQHKVSHGRPIDLSFSVDRNTYRVSNMVYNSFHPFKDIGENKVIMRKNKITWDNSLANLKVVSRKVSRKTDMDKCLISYLGAKKAVKAAKQKQIERANAPTKVCSICGKTKDRKHFAKNSRQCYPCKYIKDKERKGGFNPSSLTHNI